MLDQAYKFELWAVRDGLVALRTPDGRILISTEKHDNTLFVVFDWLDDKVTEHVRFSVNASYVGDLSGIMMSSHETKVNFGEIFDHDGSFWGPCPDENANTPDQS